MVKATTVRALALRCTEVEETPHHDRTSFRVRNKIFATLAEECQEVVVKLPLADQGALVAGEPDTFFLPGWSQQGWTGIRLQTISRELLSQLLEAAWRNVAPKGLVAKLEKGK